MSYENSKYEKLLSQLSSVTESLIPEISPMVSNAISILAANSNQIHAAFSATTVALKSLDTNFTPSDEAIKCSQIALSLFDEHTLSSIEIPQISLDVFEGIEVQYKQFTDIFNDCVQSLDKANINQNNNSHMDLTKPLAQLISSIDGSIELPISGCKEIVHVKESLSPGSFWKTFSIILSIIQFALSVYSDYSSTTLLKQQHTELMQEERAQTIEEIKQTEEAMKQTSLLKQIAENTSPNPETSNPDTGTSTSQSQ